VIAGKIGGFMNILSRAVFILGLFMCLSAHAAHSVVCEGYVDAQNPNAKRHTVVVLAEGEYKWDLNGINAGPNVSDDSNHIILENYSSSNREGAAADYNVRKKTLKFKYKADTGGGFQNVSGTFIGCWDDLN
jgi:hypothetical protein